eukprot:gene1065-1208_t
MCKVFGQGHAGHVYQERQDILLLDILTLLKNGTDAYGYTYNFNPLKLASGTSYKGDLNAVSGTYKIEFNVCGNTPSANCGTASNTQSCIVTPFALAGQYTASPIFTSTSFAGTANVTLKVKSTTATTAATPQQIPGRTMNTRRSAAAIANTTTTTTSSSQENNEAYSVDSSPGDNNDDDGDDSSFDRSKDEEEEEEKHDTQTEEEEDDEEEEEKTPSPTKRFNLRPRPGDGLSLKKKLFNDYDEEEEDNHEEQGEDEDDDDYRYNKRPGVTIKRTVSKENVLDDSPPANGTGGSSIRTRRSLDLSTIKLGSFMNTPSSHSSLPQRPNTRSQTRKMEKEEDDDVGASTIDKDEEEEEEEEEEGVDKIPKQAARERTLRDLKQQIQQPLPATNSRRVRTPTPRYLNDAMERTIPRLPHRPNTSARVGGPRKLDTNHSDDEDDAMGSQGRLHGGPMPVNMDSTEPLAIDTSVTFASVGGLHNHITLLKEMLILPLVYPEVFGRFAVQPPKGVLFYGSPGTGKTLLARALVNECNASGGQKVSFFMRKGADCLSKWVGEAERQLRSLFDQAKSMAPSIIFFDEIDGLAPVRSARQDHIHSSMVSTLLALMDGLDARGQVIVIGATNRIDAIDPALRRPGRFDRELLFSLPNKQSRRTILGIHTAAWEPPIAASILDTVAETAAGYCGADLKALTAEAVLCALRSTYPQIYETRNKLKLSPDAIQVDMSHFRAAMAAIVPTSRRAIVSFATPLGRGVRPLLASPLESLMTRTLPALFPLTLLKGAPLLSVYRPRLLLSGGQGMGALQLGNAVLYEMEEFPTFAIDICTLLSDPTAKSIEESACRVLGEAKKVAPAILYLPNIERWWDVSSLGNTLLGFLTSLDAHHPLFVLATANHSRQDLSDDILAIFGDRSDSVFSMEQPTESEIFDFLRTTLLNIKDGLYQVFQAKRVKKKAIVELPIVPMAATPDTRDRDRKQEMQFIRQLRILLRDVTSKIIYDKKYFTFFRDVNIQLYPEYYEIIKNPMSLFTITNNLENHKYSTVSGFLNDIDLIVTNTIEYYQVHDPYGIDGTKAIQRAKQLQDEVFAMIDQIDPVLILTCENIASKRKDKEGETTPPINSVNGFGEHFLAHFSNRWSCVLMITPILGSPAKLNQNRNFLRLNPQPQGD